MKAIGTQRPWVLTLAIVSLIVLAVESFMVMPRILAEWHPYDYWQYVQMGKAIREGTDPWGPGRYYPLPTVLWIFLPLTFLPDWFKIIWVLAPFLFLLILFGKHAAPMFLFLPLWFVVGDGMLDGWLLLPMAWLVSNRRILAGIGAVLLLAKPHLAILAVIYAVWHWIMKRDKHNLAAFILGSAVFILPAFLFDPFWLSRFFDVLSLRAGETTSVMPLMTSSAWSWWSLGGLAYAVFIALAIVAGVLVWQVGRSKTDCRIAVCQSINLLFMPVLYASNLIVLIPTLSNPKQLIVMVVISLGAYILDKAMGGFGGGYALVPIVSLYFYTRTPEFKNVS